MRQHDDESTLIYCRSVAVAAAATQDAKTMAPNVISAPTTLSVCRECTSPHNAMTRESFWILFNKRSPSLMICSYLQPCVTELHMPPHPRARKFFLQRVVRIHPDGLDNTPNRVNFAGQSPAINQIGQVSATRVTPHTTTLQRHTQTHLSRK